MTCVVETGVGKLRGSREGSVVRFLGVPYAAPPTGQRRFRAPVPHPSWGGVRPALAHGPSAPQPLGLMSDIPPSAEDCLHLSIWTPSTGGRRPVMVWLHGGGFTSGSAGQPWCDGARLAARGDVVVVNINYRLGLFGFCFLEGLFADAGLAERFDMVGTANAGLRDQMAGLAWVREHIQAFGGDPANVTVFGSSAGAMCLSSMLATPLARGLFDRAIAQSGAADHAIHAEDALAVADRLLKSLGGDIKDPSVLWRATVADLLAAQPACVRHPVRRGHPARLQAVKQMGLGLVADGDLLPTDVRAAIASGVVPVPLIVGTNADEWNFYIHLSDRGKLELDPDGVRKVAESRAPGWGARAARLYFDLPELSERAPWQVFSAIETDRNFFLPACDLGALHARHAKTFAYLFDRPSPLFDGAMGASHAVETPYVLGTVGTKLGKAFCGDGARALQVSDALIDAWSAFARSGEPGAVLGTRWDAYRADELATLEIGDEARIRLDPRPRRRRFWAD